MKRLPAEPEHVQQLWLNDLTDEEVIVKLLGGELSVRWDRKVNHVFLEGPAVKVFDGVL